LISTEDKSADFQKRGNKVHREGEGYEKSISRIEHSLVASLLSVVLRGRGVNVRFDIYEGQQISGSSKGGILKYTTRERAMSREFHIQNIF